MNPTIAADVARCAMERWEAACISWYDANPGSDLAARLDRLMVREMNTVSAMQATHRVPYVVIEAEPVDADDAPVQFTNEIGNEDAAFNPEEATRLHEIYQQAGAPYTVRWSAIRRQEWGGSDATHLDPAEVWLEDEWLDNSAQAWTEIK